MDLTSITSHIHNWVLFLLWLHLFILSEVISPLISSSILGIYWPREFIFQSPVFLPFHTVHGVVKARILKWFAIPFSSGPCLSELSTMTCPSWVPLHGMAHSFIELDTAVVPVTRLVSFLWLCFQSVCPLMPSCNNYHCYTQVAKSPSDHQGADIQCKSKRVFITKLELCLSLLPTQWLRIGASNSGLQCLYRVFSREKFEKGSFWVGRRLIGYLLWKD